MTSRRLRRIERIVELRQQAVDAAGVALARARVHADAAAASSQRAAEAASDAELHRLRILGRASEAIACLDSDLWSRSCGAEKDRAASAEQIAKGVVVELHEAARQANLRRLRIELWADRTRTREWASVEQSERRADDALAMRHRNGPGR